MSNYTTGQAVIDLRNNKLGIVSVLNSDKLACEPLIGKGLSVGGDHDNFRPATVPEILAEAAKNWWVYDEYISAPSLNIRLSNKYGRWDIEPNFTSKPKLENLAEFGNECITAHRLIQALNLCEI